ncbi:MAG TPA: glycosyltransferase family 2 protein [Candidatus Eisenbacteria bacterium]|nr:glycosyltransferase family 2 protein [Candidatus Eisenbacteria bacterium]
MRVAVVIVTYNSARFIPDCLGSLSRIEKGGLETDVIVIDNGSTDASVEMLKAYPFAEVVPTGKNLGFAGGNNLGIRMALDRGCEYVYLLNHDTEATPRFLVEAVAMAETDPKIGAAQSLLLLSPDKELVNSTGNAIHFLGFGYCMDYRRRADSLKFEGRKEIAYASGAGVLLRASALKKVGLFDEELFLYHEDLDLGWRLRLAGYVNVLAPKSVVHHKYEFSRSISKYYYMERNRYVVHVKNLRWWTLLVLAPWLALSELGLLAVSFRSGWWKEKRKVYGYFLKPAAWRHMMAGRKETAKLRTVGDREIVRLFTPTISFQDVTGPFTKYVANPIMTAVWAVARILII